MPRDYDEWCMMLNPPDSSEQKSEAYNGSTPTINRKRIHQTSSSALPKEVELPEEDITF